MYTFSDQSLVSHGVVVFRDLVSLVSVTRRLIKKDSEGRVQGVDGESTGQRNGTRGKKMWNQRGEDGLLKDNCNENPV